MGSGKRASAPAPLRLDTSSKTSTRRDDYRRGRKTSSVSTNSSQSTASSLATSPSASSTSSSSSSRRKQISPTVNVYTTCGRHTDQYLFGGRSLTDLARSVWSKNH